MKAPVFVRIPPLLLVFVPVKHEASEELPDSAPVFEVIYFHDKPRRRTDGA